MDLSSPKIISILAENLSDSAQIRSLRGARPCAPTNFVIHATGIRYNLLIVSILFVQVSIFD